MRKRVEHILNPSLIQFEPPLRPKRLRAVSPNLWITMDGVDGYAQNRALWEKLSRNVQPTLGSNTGKTHGKGAKQSEAFVDDGVKVRKTFDDCPGCDRVVVVSEGLVERCPEFGLGGGIPGEVVVDSAGSTRIRVISVNIYMRDQKR